MLPLARVRELAREKSFRREAGKFDLDPVELKLLMLTSISKQTVLFVLKNTSKKKKERKILLFCREHLGVCCLDLPLLCGWELELSFIPHFLRE